MGYVALVEEQNNLHLALVISTDPVLFQVFQLCRAKSNWRKHRFLPVDVEGAVSTDMRGQRQAPISFTRARSPWRVSLDLPGVRLSSKFAPYPTPQLLADWAQFHRYSGPLKTAHDKSPEALHFPEVDLRLDGPYPPLNQSETYHKANESTALRLRPRGVAPTLSFPLARSGLPRGEADGAESTRFSITLPPSQAEEVQSVTALLSPPAEGRRSSTHFFTSLPRSGTPGSDAADGGGSEQISDSVPGWGNRIPPSPPRYY